MSELSEIFLKAAEHAATTRMTHNCPTCEIYSAVGSAREKATDAADKFFPENIDTALLGDNAVLALCFLAAMHA